MQQTSLKNKDFVDNVLIVFIYLKSRFLFSHLVRYAKEKAMADEIIYTPRERSTFIVEKSLPIKIIGTTDGSSSSTTTQLTVKLFKYVYDQN